MSARQPKLEMFWSPVRTSEERVRPDIGDTVRVAMGQDYHVNWRIVGANCEIMCHSNQGYRDKTDALRSIDSLAAVLGGNSVGLLKIVGPGRKPK